jgi:hypothetical protein
MGTVLFIIFAFWLVGKVITRHEKKTGRTFHCPGVLDPPEPDNINIIIRGEIKFDEE